MQRSDDVSELVKALVAAQAAMTNPVFDKVNPHFKSPYASLAQVRSTVVPVLAAQGLVVTQHLSSNDDGVLCETVLWHTSGQFLSEQFFMPAQALPQAYGSAAAYARRYSLLALCNVAGDDDDDAAEAPTRKHGLASGKLERPMSGDQAQQRARVVERIIAIFHQQGVTDAVQQEWWSKRQGLTLPQLERLLHEMETAQQAKQSGKREGAAWTTLRAHEHNASLSRELRDEITMLLTSPGVTEERALALAGAVHDWVSQAEEAQEDASL